MSGAMTEDSNETADLMSRAAGGDAEALRALFSRYWDRLKRMVHLQQKEPPIFRPEGTEFSGWSLFSPASTCKARSCL
jgi:hypothetical protein